MTDRELMQMALDALLQSETNPYAQVELAAQEDAAIEALRARLAQPEREWQGLTDEEIRKIVGVTSADSDWNVTTVHKWIRDIEQALREKNHG